MLYILTIFAVLCVVLFGFEYILPYIRKHRNIVSLQAMARCTRSIVLTYDDGPGATLTKEVLQVLRQHSVHATFFILGSRAHCNHELVDNIRQNGHEIGSHSMNHLNAWKSLPWISKKDVESGHTYLAPWLSPHSLFRPPYGKLCGLSELAMKRRGALAAWWTADSGDTWPKLPEVNELLKQIVSQQGCIVLLHDFDRTGFEDFDARHKYVIDTTRAVLDLAKDQNFCVVTYGQLLSRFKDMQSDAQTRE